MFQELLIVHSKHAFEFGTGMLRLANTGHRLVCGYKWAKTSHYTGKIERLWQKHPACRQTTVPSSIATSRRTCSTPVWEQETGDEWHAQNKLNFLWLHWWCQGHHWIIARVREQRKVRDTNAHSNQKMNWVLWVIISAWQSSAAWYQTLADS